MKKEITITERMIVNFVCDHVNILSPGTRDNYTLWDKGGKIIKTDGSMEFRSDDYAYILELEFCNEFAPYTRKQVGVMVSAAMADELEEC